MHYLVFCVTVLVPVIVGLPVTSIPTHSPGDNVDNTTLSFDSPDKRSSGTDCCAGDRIRTPWRQVQGVDSVDRVLCPYIMRCRCDCSRVPSKYWVAELDTSQGQPQCRQKFANAYCVAMQNQYSFYGRKGPDGKDISDCQDGKNNGSEATLHALPVKYYDAAFICMADPLDQGFVISG